MVVQGVFLAIALVLGVQASPKPISIEGGFEDVEAEAIVIEAEEAGRGRSGRQLWDTQGRLINPILALNPDGSTGILYQGFPGFQPGIIGQYPGAWPGQGGHHPGGHPGGWPAAGGSPGGWPGAGGSPAGPGGWPPAIQPAPTHPPSKPTPAPWNPPAQTQTTKAPVTAAPPPPQTQPVVAETPVSGGGGLPQQCGVGKHGAIRYNADGLVAEEISRINGTHPFRVVNGWPADPNEWPWQAALLNKGRQFCAGSLIDDKHILTAAHCVAHMSRNDVANLKIRLGAHYIKRGESGTHESKAARVVRHKGFSQQTLHWDVAIITMETPAPTGNPKIGPVCLPSGSQTYAEQTATVTGWGSLRENGPQPDELMEVTVRIWDNAQCKSTYGKAAPGGIESHMLCAGQKGKDSCNGDSGGPMVMGMGSTWTQIGVVSWGIGCGKSHYPGVYTRVTVVRDWIDRIIRDY